MLADRQINPQAGFLGREVQIPGAARQEILNFVASELPRWRDHPERQRQTSEDVLSGQLCDHLNSAARISEKWDWIQFRTEVADEIRKNRAIDLAAKVCGQAVVIEGRRHTQFDTLLPIECKRLPTPREGNRDEREYVVTAAGSSGGIQRFKFGHHGCAHGFAEMIGYVQEQTFRHWLTLVNQWIADLASSPGSGWSSDDVLGSQEEDSTTGVCTLHSRHVRVGVSGEIDLQHLWVKMN